MRRFSLEIGRTFVAIPVRNQMAEYLEWYAVDAPIFSAFRADPSLAHEFVERCKRRSTASMRRSGSPTRTGATSWWPAVSRMATGPRCWTRA